MVALYRCGRQADALRAYQRARHGLIEQLGIEPGPELRAIEAGILNQDPAIGSATDRGVGPSSPASRYVETSDGLKVAYWTRGESAGPDVVLCAEWTFNLELLWDLDELRPLLERLSACRRLIVVQRRGTGLSDRSHGVEFATPETCVADIDAVLGNIGASAVSMVGWGHGGQVALAYAAKRPTRVTRVALINSYARLGDAPDYAAGHKAELLEGFLGLMERRGVRWLRSQWSSPRRWRATLA
jgi:pimeloyl-ACP methyl ester carboxylesterase